MDRDGTKGGYDLELLDKVSQAVSVPIIASGGAGTASHLAEALNGGADAALLASILHDQEQSVGSIKKDLAILGIDVRL